MLLTLFLLDIIASTWKKYHRNPKCSLVIDTYVPFYMKLGLPIFCEVFSAQIPDNSPVDYLCLCGPINCPGLSLDCLRYFGISKNKRYMYKAGVGGLLHYNHPSVMNTNTLHFREALLQVGVLTGDNTTSYPLKLSTQYWTPHSITCQTYISHIAERRPGGDRQTPQSCRTIQALQCHFRWSKSKFEKKFIQKC